MGLSGQLLEISSKEVEKSHTETISFGTALIVSFPYIEVYCISPYA
jgi:hypothetical protein